MKIMLPDAENQATQYLPGNDELFSLMKNLMKMPNPELVAENPAMLEHWREAAGRAKALVALQNAGHSFDFDLRGFVVGFPRMAFRIEFARRVITLLGSNIVIE